MQHEKGGSGFNPEAQPNPYAQIPDLVRRSILARPKDARRAQGQMLGLIKSDPYFDPVLFAVAETQRILLGVKDTRQLKTASDLLREVIAEGLGRNEPKAELTLNATPQIRNITEAIIQNDERIQKRNLLRKFPSANYNNLRDYMPSVRDILEHESKKVGKRIILDVQHVSSREVNEDAFKKLQQENARFNEWLKITNGLFSTSRRDPDLYQVQRDVLVDTLKAEPHLTLTDREDCIQENMLTLV